jgi:signal transduction histidine kinase
MVTTTVERRWRFLTELTRSGDVLDATTADDRPRCTTGWGRWVVTGDVLVDVRGPTAEADGRLLERVGLVLNSTLELTEVLASLSEITREFSGSDSCGIFLLRGDAELYPTVAIGAEADDERFRRFLAMGPITLDDDQLAVIRAGRAVAFGDAEEASGLVPQPWLDAFDIGALVLVPLLAADEPCGLMAVDWRAARSFEPGEIRLLEAIASHAGVAVANARLFGMVRRRAQLQSALARWAGSLASPLEPEEITSRLVDAYAELLGTCLCGIGVRDEAGIVVTTVASGGTDEDEVRAPFPMDAIPAHITQLARREWRGAARRRAIDLGDDPWLADALGGREAGAGWYLLLPLHVAGHARGAVVLGFPPTTVLDDDEREAAEALADIAAAALERHELVQRLGRQLRQRDALHRVSAALTEGADGQRLVDDLNDLLSGHGIAVVGITFRDRGLARHLGGDEPLAAERAAWRARNRPGPTPLPDGALSLPMRVGDRLVGMLRVKPSDLTAEQRTFLDALARGLAEVAYRGSLRAKVEEAARERAVAADRERMADDLHDTAGQVFVAIGLLARRQAGKLQPGSPDAKAVLRLAELADGGKWEIEQAVRALPFVPAPRRGLVPSLRALARSVQADSGIDVSVEVVGEPARLDARVERALYRVFHEGVTNAWRHAQCHAVRVVLRFTDDGVRLRVRDDGVGLGAAAGGLAGPFGGRRPDDDGSHIGLAAMRRAVAEVGGTVEVSDAEPSGVLVDAWAPRARDAK